MEIDRKEDLNLATLHFTLSEEQYKKLRKIKDENYIKIIYMIRLSTVYVINHPEVLKKRNDYGYESKTAKHYKIDLKTEVYDEILKLSKEKKMSKSKILRIGINELLQIIYF